MGLVLLFRNDRASMEIKWIFDSEWIAVFQTSSKAEALYRVEGFGRETDKGHIRGVLAVQNH